MSITLSKVLKWMGKLDDSQLEDTARERFRNYLKEEVTGVDQLRDYIEECLRNSGEQYSRALQDLVNRLGELLGFKVTYGRYKGVQAQNGFDGHWISPTESFHVVVEVKTSEVYPIRTTTLVGYINHLISDQEIPSSDDASGLYIVGRIDEEIQQLESKIITEKKTHLLRSISVKSLLSLAEMMNQYSLSHNDILSLLRPSTPRIDSVVNLMEVLISNFTNPLVSQPKPEEWEKPEELLGVEQEEENLPNDQPRLGRRPSKTSTPQKDYKLPILKALVELGGKGETEKVRERVEELMKNVLKEQDYQPLPSIPNKPRWHNATKQAREEMMKEGLLKKSSHGIWEISEAGRQYLAQGNTDVSK